MGTVGWSNGEVRGDVMDAVNMATGNDAATFRRSLADELQRAGYECLTEVRAPIRGRVGRLDLVARRDAYSVALECDRMTPRKKSLEKLRAYPCDGRVVALRGAA